MKRNEINMMVGVVVVLVFALSGCGGGSSSPSLQTPTPVANTVPVANAGAAQSVVTGAVVTLDGSASSDANGGLLTYSWAFTSKPTGSSAVLSSATVVKPTFTADVAGSYVLHLVVNDGKVNSAAVAVTITAAVANEQTAPNLTISVSDTLSGKTVTPLLGVNAGPTPQGDSTNVDVTVQYKAIGVTAVRTHDLYDPLDMSVMYPDRTKDPALSSSYNFTSSDKAFDAIIAGGFEPYFRIGDSWDNVTPPTNETERANWAAAATYIVGHYRARGTFKYAEIWNEPDFTSQFWPSPRTRMEFLDLYARTAKAIKTSFPDLKVGGPAFTQASFMTASGKEYLNAFLLYVKSNSAPLDFISWHCYSNSPSDYSDGATYFRQQLDANGFVSAENIISEFNTSDKDKSAQEIQSLRLGGQGAAIITGSWISLVKGGINKAFLYRGNDTSMNMSTFYGLFYANGTYKRNAHAFSLWSKITSYPSMLDVTMSSSTINNVSQIYTLAGKNSSGKKAILVANPTSTVLTTSISGLNVPLRVRIVSDIGTSLQETSQAATTVSLPAYSTTLISSDGL